MELPENEQKELEETRLFLLAAIRDRTKYTTEDALKYAASYSYLVNAWLPEKHEQHQRKSKSNSKRTAESPKSGTDS